MNNRLILGLDIGGANTKTALIQFKNEVILESLSHIEYFPFWEKTLHDLPKMIDRILSILLEKKKIQLDEITNIAITITAELSDAFQTKREGILTIIDALESVFDKEKMRFVNNEGEYVDCDQARHNYLKVSAANWVSTALFLGRFMPNCILIDAGSTTIDIIPILNSIPVSKGKDDTSRLMWHELIYTGGLRATIPSITHFIPYKGKNIRISFEKFALISDVHRILDNISEQEYINDTADNRSTSLDDCYSRLARIICKDIETISKDELINMAKYIYNKQLEIISSEIQEFFNELKGRVPEFNNDPIFVITGLAAEFLIKKSLENLGFNNIKIYEKITNIPDHVSSSAFAVAGALNFKLS